MLVCSLLCGVRMVRGCGRVGVEDQLNRRLHGEWVGVDVGVDVGETKAPQGGGVRGVLDVVVM